MSQTSAKEKTSNDGICISQVKIPVSVPYQVHSTCISDVRFHVALPLKAEANYCRSSRICKPV